MKTYKHLTIEVSPNVQYWIGRDKIEFVVISDQILAEDQVSHIGNVFPSKLIYTPDILKKIKNYSMKICEYLHELGCYSLVGIDFLITKNGQIYSPEINARLNASTFSFLITKKLFHKSEIFFGRVLRFKLILFLFENYLIIFQINLLLPRKNSVSFPLILMIQRVYLWQFVQIIRLLIIT